MGEYDYPQTYEGEDIHPVDKMESKDEQGPENRPVISDAAILKQYFGRKRGRRTVISEAACFSDKRKRR